MITKIVNFLSFADLAVPKFLFFVFTVSYVRHKKSKVNETEQSCGIKLSAKLQDNANETLTETKACFGFLIKVQTQI